MNARDVAEPALVFNAKENVSKVVAGMISSNKQEAIILEKGNKGKMAGVVFASSLVRRRINNPTKTRISRFIEHINPLSPAASIESVVKSFLANDYKSIPMKKGDSYFFITKLNALNAIKGRKELRAKRAGDIMNPPYCISADDSIDTAISVIKETGVSRLPVIGTNGRVEGLLDHAAMLGAYAEKTRMKLGEEVGEKTSLGHARASILMKKRFPKVKSGMPLKQVIESMADKRLPTAIVTDGDGNGKGTMGIITPKPIFRLFAGRPKGALVRVDGMNEESDFLKSVVDKEIRSGLQKLGNIIPIRFLVVRVDKHSRTGRRRNYSVHARLIAEKGMFFADHNAWDITKAVRGVMNRLETEVIRKVRKASSH